MEKADAAVRRQMEHGPPQIEAPEADINKLLDSISLPKAAPGEYRELRVADGRARSRRTKRA